MQALLGRTTVEPFGSGVTLCKQLESLMVKKWLLAPLSPLAMIFGEMLVCGR